MGFRCGIVGLPNVGKSTLFSPLTHTQAAQAAQAANYPVGTIEPNIGRVAVAGEAGRRAAGDDVRFMSDVAMRLQEP